MAEVQIPLTNNEVKIYYHNQFQKLSSSDLNRLSGAEPLNSNFPAILTSILATIGRTTDTAIGFQVTSSDNRTIQVGPGIIIRPDSVYLFPSVTLTPSPGSVCGIFEISLESLLTDNSAVQVWNIESERFQPQVRPTRKTFQTILYEQWNAIAPLPSSTPGRLSLLSYEKSSPTGPITSLLRTLPVYDPALIGIDVELNPGIEDNDSLASAINWLYEYIQDKEYIRTTPSPGYDNANFRVRTQGNLAFWSKNEGVNWLPFA
ncbi:hypothetical protein [Leptospira yasudae]|uniref:hypothetical protein n=1 Tax=Leptospira yasudae TaxID=2202201 RepID=UPI0010918028|nr:hypothetical protein [Leptospira yasudae]TGM99729.1 hypothetical protein EHR10_09060 [Leptospira yasudae]